MRFAIAVTATAMALASVTTIVTSRPTAEPDPVPSVVTSTSETPTPTASPSKYLGDPLAALPPAIAKLAREVEDIRGLRFLRPFKAEILKPKELQKRLTRLFVEESDPEQTRANARSLVQLGLLAPGTDLVAVVRRFLVGSIAGIYLTDIKTFYVGSLDGTLSPATRYYGAHELVHALTDQHFDLGRIDEDDDPFHADAISAFQALAEGDATIVASEYYSSMSAKDRSEFHREVNAAAPAPDAPYVLERSLQFPYETGTPFVQRLIEEGGWRAVNKAYRDLPASTEQVLHPFRYLHRDAPTPVDAPHSLPGATLIEEGAFGEADLMVVLDGDRALRSGLSAEEAERAAKGWDGGSYRTVRRQGSIAVIMSVVFDDPAELTEARERVDRWLSARFGGRGSAIVVEDGIGWRASDGVSGRRLVGDQLIFAVGTDSKIVRDLLAAQRQRA